MTDLGDFGRFWVILGHFGAVSAIRGPLEAFFSRFDRIGEVWSGFEVIGLGLRVSVGLECIGVGFGRFLGSVCPFSPIFWQILCNFEH